MKKIFLFFWVPFFAIGQSPVVTAFPSLRIPASSRGLAMGDLGIASASENQQLYYNVAKSAFTQNFHQVSVSYTPWLSSLSNDIRFVSVNYLGNVYNTSAMGVTLNYLNLGDITSRDNNGASIATYHAREFNVGASFALQVNDKTSLGLALKMLGQNTFTETPKNRIGVCGDFSYYQFANVGDDPNQRIEWGIVVSNIGPKINSGDFTAKTCLPTNLGLGIGYATINGEDGSRFQISMDMNKLLVPGIFSSFNEPDQIKRIRISCGLEYGYMNEFFLRSGFSLENAGYGNRKFIGLGVGYKGLVMDQSLGIDFHYLVPYGTATAVSPFQNSFGFSIHFSFGNFQ